MTNNGNTEAEKVSLVMPYQGIAQIRLLTTSVPISTLSFDGSISIGSLRPSDEIKVYVWTTQPPSAAARKDIHVPYAKGVGQIVYQQINEGLRRSFYHALPQMVPYALIAFLLALGFQLIGRGLWLEWRRSRQQDSTK